MLIAIASTLDSTLDSTLVLFYNAPLISIASTLGNTLDSTLVLFIVLLLLLFAFHYSLSPIFLASCLSPLANYTHQYTADSHKGNPV